MMKVVGKSVVTFVCLVSACALWVFFYLPYLNIHFTGIDTAAYIVGAKSILNGGVLYHDFCDNKPPLIFFIFALILKLFGSNNYPALNYVTLCCLFASTLLVYHILKMLSSRFFALLGALLYPIVSNLFIATSALEPNTEIYMELGVLAGLFFGLKALEYHRPYFFLFSGIATGIASAFKQPGLVTLAALMAGVVMFYVFQKRFRVILISIAWLGVGFCSVWIAICIYFLSHGVLHEFWFMCFQFNYLYSGNIPAVQIIHRFWFIIFDYASEYPLLFIPYMTGLILSIYMVTTKGTDFEGRFCTAFVLLWHFADLAAISIGGLFLPHYFVQWIPSFLAVVCMPLAQLIHYFRSPVQFRILAGIAVYFCLASWPALSSQQGDYIVRYTSPKEVQKLLSPYITTYGMAYYQYPRYHDLGMYPEYQRLINYIIATVPEGESFLVWGFEPALYLLADRAPASRFIHTGVISGNYIILENIYALSSKNLSYQRLLSQKFFSDLIKNQPRLIIVEDKKRTLYSRQFWRYIDEDYSLSPVHFNVPFEVYIRNDRKTGN